MTSRVDPDLFQWIVGIRRDLHRHPELSWGEERTSGRVFAHLEELGLRPRRILDTGILVDLPGTERVPTIALRADLDALPIQEETGLPFTSVNDGVMHACGHDGHTSMLLGGAALLVRGGPLAAPVRLIFQPAEERSVPQLHAADLEIEITAGTPCLSNGPTETALAREAADQVVGANGVVELEHANLGAEDFSQYLQQVPGCYVRFGGQAVGREGFPAHSSRFDFDERALAIGAEWYSAVTNVAARSLAEHAARRVGALS